MRNPSYVEEYVHRIGSHTDAAKDNLRVSALWSLGVACREAFVKVRGEEIRGNVYILIVGPPGKSRKSWTIARAAQIVRSAGIRHVRQLAGFSTESFADLLYHYDADLALDEFRQFAYAVSKEYGSGVLPLLNGLWNGTEDIVEMPYRTKPIVIPRGRRASILSAVTPMWLASSSGDFLDEMLRSGLMSRFIVSWPETDDNPDGDHQGVESSVAHLAAMLAIRSTYYKAHREVTIQPNVYNLIRKSQPPHEAASDEEICSRYQAHLLRLAFLYALSDQSSVITAENIAQAKQSTFRALDSASRLVVLSTHSARVQTTILEVLKRNDRPVAIPDLALTSRYEMQDVEIAVRHLEQREKVRRIRDGTITMVTLLKDAP